MSIMYAENQENYPSAEQEKSDLPALTAADYFASFLADSDNEIEHYESVQTSLAPSQMQSAVALQPSKVQNLIGDIKLCCVCGDKSTGRHYSAPTCDGCKGFFRRHSKTLSQPLEWCRHSPSIEITKATRNLCKFCRFGKCVAMGMTKDKVIAKDSKVEAPPPMEFFLEENQITEQYLEMSPTATMISSAESDVSQKEAEPVGYYEHMDGHAETAISETAEPSGKTSEPLELDSLSPVNTDTDSVASSPDTSDPNTSDHVQSEMAKDIIRIHKESCAFTMDKVSELLNGDLVPANIPITNHLEAWHHFASLMDLEIREIYEFLGSLDYLKTNHQQTVALLQNSAFKIYLLRVIRSLFPQGMVLRDGRVIDCQILNFIFGEQIVTEMLQLSDIIRNACLTDEEVALFLVMVLLETASGNQSLVDDIYVDLRPTPIFSRLQELKEKLENINNNFMNGIVPWLRDNQKSLQLPQVFSEVFNISWTGSEVENVNPTTVPNDEKI